MSFIEVPGPHYIKRTLLFVNSDDRDPLESESNYDFTYPLKEELQQVFSLEVVQIDYVRFAAVTMLGRYDIYSVYKNGFVVEIPQNSNMKSDILIQDETKANSVQFSTDLDPGLFIFAVFPWGGVPLNSEEFWIAYVLDLVGRYSIAVTGNPVFGGGNYQFVADLDQNYRLRIALENTTVIPSTYGFITFQFATGPNRLDQISIPVGAQPYTDVSSNEATANNELYLPYITNTRQFNYVDIILEQAREFRPWFRYPLLDELGDNHSRPKNLPHRVRILKEPVRNLKKLSFRIRAAQNIILSTFADVGMDITIEALSISQVPSVPEWVKQRLIL